MDESYEIRCLSESKPLKTLEELLNWNSLEECINSKSYTVSPLQMHKTSSENRVKTLLCHDMKGGYLDDRFNDGSGNELAYSHEFISIPPLGWINASHRNGVPILGTLIVEGWTHAKSICTQVLSSTDIVERVASKLVEISKLYHIDGWLINIECEVESKNISNLVYFLKLLTEMMRIHVSHSLVIWYDSVISPDGQLKWQNELNHSNKCFFDVCDGIFLNYTWNQSNLKNSYEISQKLSRNYDVFVGIDVFGRNCFGGGGLNTNLAVKEILKYELSIAIFAAGWTHEALGTHNFTANEYSFWSALELGVHHYPNKFPIRTSFCQGFGCKLFRSGRIISYKSWHNLSQQQLQPSCHDFLDIYLDDAYNGGGSLRIKNNLILLFKCDLKIEKCVYAITYKSRINEKLTTIFNYTLNNGNESRPKSIAINCLDLDKLNNEDFKVEYIANEKQSTGQELSVLNKYGLFESYNGWVTDCFILKNKKSSNQELTVKSINLSYNKFSEDEKIADILIGQMLFDSI